MKLARQDDEEREKIKNLIVFWHHEKHVVSKLAEPAIGPP